jgi:hypothetical protein
VRRTTFCLLLVALAACSRETPPAPPAHRPVTDLAPGRVDIGGAIVSLPQRIGEWTRPDAARRITADTIFDYMDGAGELYLAYRFDHLDVFEYKARDASAGTIVVDIYSMKTPDDAFGLLSNDWGGEPALLGGDPPPRESAALPPHRALYGAGLLRLWSGTLFARVLASRETPESRAAVLEIARALTTREVGGGAGSAPASPAPPPVILAALAAPTMASSQIRPDRTCFFRSYLVLNSQYFLASQDILGLGLDVDAATTEFRRSDPGERPLRVILIRYPSSERASAGLKTFGSAFLRGVAGEIRAMPQAGSARVEHGWVGWAQKAQDLAIALDAATSAAARQAATSLVAATPAAGSGDK